LKDWILSKEMASRISQPVLYILGAESGPNFSRAKEVFQPLVKQTEVVQLPGMNHLLMMRNSGVVAKPIAEFLARHPL
jgi:pimeloyl-ACP methyl ester carboxylesterase